MQFLKLRSCPKENHIADEKLFEAAGFSGCELSDDSVPDEAEDDVNEEDDADTASELAEAVTGTISGFELCTGRSLFITKADTNTDAEYIKDIDIAIIMTAA